MELKDGISSAQAQTEPDRARNNPTRKSSGLVAFRSMLTGPWSSAITWAAVTYVAVVSLMPIIMTPYLQDDTLNRTPPQLTSDPNATHFSVFLEVTHAWMSRQGRFMPGAVALRDFVFTFFNTRETYKLYLFFLSMVLLVVVGLLTTRVTRRPAVFVPTMLCLCMTWSLRVWADALDTFHGVVPITVLFSLLSLLLVLNARRSWMLIAAGVFWSVSLVTYEVAILLTPVMCLVLWLTRADQGLTTRASVLWRQAVFIVPALADGLFVVWLRTQVIVEPVPAYRVNLDVRAVAETFVKQLSAALPLSQYWYPGVAPPDIPVRLVVISLFFIGLPVGVALIAARSGLCAPSPRAIATVAVVGLGSWLASGVLVAVTLRWQETLPPGQGYLSVIWGYVGVSLCSLSVWLWLAQRSTATRSSLVSSAAFYSWCALVAVTVSLTFVANLTIASTLSYPAA